MLWLFSHCFYFDFGYYLWLCYLFICLCKSTDIECVSIVMRVNWPLLLVWSARVWWVVSRYKFVRIVEPGGEMGPVPELVQSNAARSESSLWEACSLSLDLMPCFAAFSMFYLCFVMFIFIFRMICLFNSNLILKDVQRQLY